MRRGRFIIAEDWWQRKVTQDAETALVRSKGKVEVVYSSYLTFTEGTSYKFHMFLIFSYRSEKDGSREFLGLNAYGPIEKRMTFFEIARGKNLANVLSAVNDKERQKRAKGYN